MVEKFQKFFLTGERLRGQSLSFSSALVKTTMAHAPVAQGGSSRFQSWLGVHADFLRYRSGGPASRDTQSTLSPRRYDKGGGRKNRRIKVSKMNTEKTAEIKTPEPQNMNTGSTSAESNAAADVESTITAATSSADKSPAEPETSPASVPAEATTATTPAATTLKITNGRVSVTQIRPHEENAKTYGDRDSIADLLKSIGDHPKEGIREWLLVTKDGRIISGHRRYRAALKLEIADVPVRVFESDDELEIKRALLELNHQRTKTNVQRAAEATLDMQIEKELAARRKAAAGKSDVEKLPPAQKGKARDAVGKKLGVSGRTVDKAVQTSEAIATLRAQGKTEDAEEVEADLNKGFDTGHKKAVEKGAIKKSNAKEKAVRPKPKITPVPEQHSGASAKTPSEPSETPPATPAPPPPTLKVFDSDMALTKADEVLTFLRSDAAAMLTLDQERGWREIFEQIDETRAEIGL